MEDREEVKAMAAETVAAALSMLATAELDHEGLPLVLHMLASVLEHPEAVL